MNPISSGPPLSPGGRSSPSATVKSPTAVIHPLASKFSFLARIILQFDLTCVEFVGLVFAEIFFADNDIHNNITTPHSNSMYVGGISPSSIGDIQTRRQKGHLKKTIRSPDETTGENNITETITLLFLPDKG